MGKLAAIKKAIKSVGSKVKSGTKKVGSSLTARTIGKAALTVGKTALKGAALVGGGKALLVAGAATAVGAGAVALGKKAIGAVKGRKKGAKMPFQKGAKYRSQLARLKRTKKQLVTRLKIKRMKRSIAKLRVKVSP